MTILLPDYWMGRDHTHASELTAAIEANAAETVRRWNLLLDAASEDEVFPTVDAATRTYVASGWRPAGVNAATANSAARSKHMTGEALDVRDERHTRQLARWVLENLGKAESIGLWFERPQWTPNWVHGQIVPPGSKKRVFVPSTAAPLTAALPGEADV